MKKRFMGFIAAFVVIIAIVGIEKTIEVEAATQETLKGSSVETGITSDGFSYKISPKDGTVEIIKYNGKKKKLVFPNKINGRKVTEIGERAVSGNKYVVSVEVPDSVKKVALHAFEDCQNLTTIKLGKNVTQIGEGNEYQYDDSESLMYVGKKFKAFEVDDDNNVYYSEDGVLFKLEKDGERVLLVCPPAKTGKYSIPDGTTHVELLAFWDSHLSSVRFPATVEWISDAGYAYGDNYRSSIEEYVVDEKNAWYYTKEGVLFRKGEKENKLLHYPTEKKDRSYNIPEGVTVINIFAFYGHKYLEEVTMPDTVLYVRENAFGHCENLKSVTISGNIGDNAFGGCKSLVNVELKDTVKGIGEEAFKESGLVSIILPESLEVLEWGALGYSSLKKVEVRNRNCEIEGGIGFANKTIIYGYIDSTAEAFAKKYGYQFKLIGTEEIPEEGFDQGTITKENIKLSKTSYTYNGKAKKPEVILKDKFGNTIKKENYKVTYKNNKNVGIATVKIQLTYPYGGTIKTTFTIKPPKSNITKLTATENGFKMQWNGVKASQIDGYEIQYAANKGFEADSVQKILVNSSKTAEKNINNLENEKTYYVRIRSYKAVSKEGSTERLYSKWSDVKKIKTL